MSQYAIIKLHLQRRTIPSCSHKLCAIVWVKSVKMARPCESGPCALFTARVVATWRREPGL